MNQSSLIIFLFHLKLGSQGLVLGDTDHTGCDPIKQLITRVIPLRATGARVHALPCSLVLEGPAQDPAGLSLLPDPKTCPCTQNRPRQTTKGLLI